MKKAISIILALLMLTSSMSVFARASDYIDSYSVYVEPQGGGVVKVTAEIEGTHSKMTKIGFPTIVLFELNGSTWKSVKVVNSQYTSSKGSYSYSFTYQGTAGKHYYAGASFYAEDSTGHDLRDVDSLSVKAT